MKEVGTWMCEVLLTSQQHQVIRALADRWDLPYEQAIHRCIEITARVLDAIPIDEQSKEGEDNGKDN